MVFWVSDFGRLLRGSVALVLCGCALSCGDGNKDGGGSTPVPVRGSERLGWDQPADSLQQLKALTFKIYVDGKEFPLADTQCAETSSAKGFACSGRLPPMTAGQHTLELTSVLAGKESARSSPLLVSVSASSLISSAAPLPLTARSRAATPESGCVVRTSGNECFDVRTIVSGLGNVTALGATPDDRVFLVEDWRSVRVIAQETLLPDPALMLSEAGSRIVGLAIDSRFADSHTVFVAWTEPSHSGGSLLNITRYRELANTLGEGATIVSGLPASNDAGVPLAVDGKGLLYVALPGVQDPSDTEQQTFGGAVLRFDRDGTTPAANPQLSPVISRGYAQPHALAVDATGSRIWLSGTASGRSSLATIDLDSSQAQAPSPALLDSGALTVQPQSGLRGLAFTAAPDRTSVVLAAGDTLFVGAMRDGQMQSLGRLSWNNGWTLNAASGQAGNWYVAVRTDQGTGAVVALKRQY